MGISSIFKRCSLAVLTIASFLVAFKEAHCSSDPAKINARIASLGYSWTASKTSVSDLSQDQKRSLLGFILPPPSGIRVQHKTFKNMALPLSIDWRTTGAVSSVKNQGSCGACWAFSLVAALESGILHAFQFETDLSEQQLLSCNLYGYNCAIGGSFDAADLFVNPGSIEETYMPYRGRDGIACTQGSFEKIASISSWDWVTADNIDNAAIKEALQNGPLPVYLLIYDDLPAYASGVYERTTDTLLGAHAVLVVGYDDTVPTGSGSGIWIAKNSWGTGWGENGFLRIAYNNSDIGKYSVALGSVTLAGNAAPRITSGITLSGPSALVEGDSLGMAIEASDNDWWDTELTYEWTTPAGCGTLTYNKGSAEYTAPSTEKEISCNVTARVTDTAGAQATKIAALSISPNYPPELTLNAYPLKGMIPFRLNYDVDVTDRNDGDTFGYSWDFGDGSGSDTKSGEHPFLTPGAYDALVSVTDKRGKSSSASFTIEVYEGNGSGALYNAEGGCGMAGATGRGARSLYTAISFCLLWILPASRSTRNARKERYLSVR